MLNVSQLTGFNASPVDTVLTYVTQVKDNVSRTTYTFAATSIGTAAFDRQVVVSIFGNASSGPNSAISSVTVDGIAATSLVSAIQDDMIAAIWSVPVPTGTSVDIVVTFGEAQDQASIGVHALYGAAATPFDTDSAISPSAASISLSALTIPFYGCAIVNFSNDASGTVTWTNATERWDAEIGTADARHSGADITTPGTPTITADGSTDVQAIVGVAWAPPW